MNLPPPLQSALQLLGALDQFAQFFNVPGLSYQELDRRVNEFKQIVEKKYKQLALKAHPDHGGSTEAMQALNAARELVRKLKIAPRPQPLRVVYVNPFGGNASTTTTAYTGFNGVWVRSSR